MRRNWIKLYVDQCLRGSMMTELDPAERFVWFGFLLLAGDSSFEGRICITETVGYTDEQLASMLKVDVQLLRTAKRKMVKFEKIAVHEGNVIEILNWKKYQSEYDRQRPYRGKGSKVIGESYTPKLPLEGDRDRDREEEKKGEEEKPRPGASYLQVVEQTFKAARYEFDQKTLLYIADLCAEFQELDHSAEIKSKIAWWINHPLTPKSNVCLQMRNWFLIARDQKKERSAGSRVGAHPPASARDRETSRKLGEFIKQLWREAEPELDVARGCGRKAFDEVYAKKDQEIAAKAAEFSRKIQTEKGEGS